MTQELAHQELNAEGRTLQERAGALVITDQPSFERAGVFLRSVKEYLKRVGEVFDPIVRKAHGAWKEALEQQKKLEAPALEAERVLKGMMGHYDMEQRRLAQEAQRLADAESQRLQDEVTLKAALEAEARGDDQGAARILEAPTPPVPIIVPAAIVPPLAKADGVSFRSNYSAEITDLKALVQAVAAGQVPLAYVQGNLPALNQAAKAMKEELRIPGVRVVVERVGTVRV